MRRLAILLAASLAAALPISAMDTASQAVVDKLKPGKMVHIEDVGALMMGAERWCYNEDDGGCAWTDIYLEVTQEGARYEIGNAWDENTNIFSTDRGEFRDGRYICETGYDWIQTVRAFSRADGSPLFGRALETLRQEIADNAGERNDCFDYVYRGHDAAADTVTLLQRQYTAGEHDPANDAVVTLHFDKASAEALNWYW